MTTTTTIDDDDGTIPCLFLEEGEGLADHDDEFWVASRALIVLFVPCCRSDQLEPPHILYSSSICICRRVAASIMCVALSSKLVGRKKTQRASIRFSTLVLRDIVVC